MTNRLSVSDKSGVLTAIFWPASIDGFREMNAAWDNRVDPGTEAAPARSDLRVEIIDTTALQN